MAAPPRSTKNARAQRLTVTPAPTGVMHRLALTPASMSTVVLAYRR